MRPVRLTMQAFGPYSGRTVVDFRDALEAGLFGIYATIDDLARTISSSADPGSLGGSIQRYSDQKARVDERLQTIADQQEQLRERMTKTFIAADRNIALSQSTLSFLQAQVAAWNAQGN